MVWTIEEGFLVKKTYDVENMEEYSGQVIHAVLLINRADGLWKMNITVISLFIAGLFGLFSSSFKQNRYFKWYMTVYVLCFAVFVYWSMNAYQDLLEDLPRLQDFINNLKD